MTVTFLIALTIQIVTVILLRHRLGNRWLRRPVTLLVLVSVVTQGIGPLLLVIPSIGVHNNFGLGIQGRFIDLADLIGSVAMLVFTLAYLLTRPERTVTPERSADAAVAVRALDWRLLGAACIPLALLTAVGRGYNDGTAAGAGTSLSTDLAATFFVVLIVSAAAAFLLRRGTRWFLPVLLIQSALLAVTGERTPLITDSIALILMLRFAGVRVPGRQLLTAGLLTILAFLAISGVRVVHSRDLFYSDSGLTARAEALVTDITAAGGSQGGTDTPGLLTQFAVRASGVDFAGGILQAISEGQPRLSPAYVPESLLLAVPSFVWSSKLDRGLALNPAQLQIDDFGLQQINFISGMPGVYIGFLTPRWLIVLFGFLGLVFGWSERWLLRQCTPARLVLLAGAVSVAMLYEAGVPSMLVQLRAAGVLALVVKAIEMVRGRVESTRSSPLAAEPPLILRKLSLHPNNPSPLGARESWDDECAVRDH